VWSLTALWLVPLLYFLLDPTPFSVLVRREWSDTSCRFVGGGVAILMACGVAAATRLPSAWTRQVVLAALAALLLYDMQVLALLPRQRVTLLHVAWALPMIVAGAALAPILWRHRRGRRLLGITAGLAALAGAWQLSLQRDETRGRAYLRDTELRLLPRDYALGWAFCDRPEQPKTIALAGSRVWFDWFFYPLMGRRLQNRVLYCPTEHLLSDCWEPHPIEPRHAPPLPGAPAPAPPDPAVWLANLRHAGVSHVFVQLREGRDTLGADIPHELGWLQARPDGFRLVLSDEGFRIYQVLPPPSSPDPPEQFDAPVTSRTIP
jgi:hypothetical protein